MHGLPFHPLPLPPRPACSPPPFHASSPSSLLPAWPPFPQPPALPAFSPDPPPLALEPLRRLRLAKRREDGHWKLPSVSCFSGFCLASGPFKQQIKNSCIMMREMPNAGFHADDLGHWGPKIPHALRELHPPQDMQRCLQKQHKIGVTPPNRATALQDGELSPKNTNPQRPDS